MDLNAGDIAPDFVLKDQNEVEIKLSDFRGRKNVVLSFHPLAWTSLCAQQMQDLENSFSDFSRLDAVALGVSVDSLYTKRTWADSLGMKETALLADFWPQGDVAKKFGVLREADGFSERAVFIIDKRGVIRFKKVYPIKELPDLAEIKSRLKDIS